MKTPVAGHTTTVPTAFTLGLALLGMGLGFLCTGCDSKPGGKGDSAEAEVRSLAAWIDELERVYVEEGAEAFEAARTRMSRDEALLRDNPDFDTAAMVLGLGETSITKKEAELAVQLRALAKQIEANPSRSYGAWSSLERKLFSYSFGNGPVDPESVPMQLADLYWVIATTSDTHLSVTLDRLYGRYAVTDYTRYRGGLTPEEEAKARVGTEVIISKDTFASENVLIEAPKYRVRYYAALPEGEVPQGERRGFSSFWGFGTDRDGVTILEVYESPPGGGLRLHFEVIDHDTLWEGYGGWLFQVRRKGAKDPVIPLKDRVLQGADH